MKAKILNSFLSLLLLVATSFIGYDYFLLLKTNKLAKEAYPKIISFDLKRSKNIDKNFHFILANANGLNEFGSFLKRSDNINTSTLKTLDTYALVSILDSIINSDLNGERWLKNKSKADSILQKIVQRNNKLQLEINKFYKNSEEQKLNTLQEYLNFIYMLIDIKLTLERMTGFVCCLCFHYHEVVGIPSKKIVEVGDTVLIDWVNRYGGHRFIDGTYQVKSNYDEFHFVETYYDPCGCYDRGETVLLEEYQIPFSKIDSNKKWRSVFYFRKKNSEQDSVVLERELDF